MRVDRRGHLNREEFIEYLQRKAAGLGIAAEETAAALAWEFFQEVLAGNRTVNLTAITLPEEFACKHVLDSWVCCRFLNSPGRLVDVGSGAGFPGIPIKILRPELEVVLLEASQKKCRFLRVAAERLGLKGIEVLNCRAEEAGRREEWRESFDFATCRAVGEFAAVAEYCLPLLRPGGRLLALRGRQGDTEALAGQRAVEELGGGEVFLFPYSLAGEKSDEEPGPGRAVLGRGEEEYQEPGAEPGEKDGTGETRWLVMVEKVRPTPSRYPRRSAAIAKRPLR